MMLHILRLTIITFLLIASPCSAELSEAYRAMDTFSSVFAIIQNDYIMPTDNRELLKGTIKGIRNLLGKKITVRESDDKTKMQISFSDAQGSVIDIQKVNNNAYMMLNSVAMVLSQIFSEFPETNKTDIIYAATEGMVATLDPHCAFIKPNEFLELQITNEGDYKGVGIDITVRDGLLTIVSPFTGSPALRAGLRANDNILKIQDIPTTGMNLKQAVNFIRGAKDSEVVLSIMRKGWKEPRNFTIKRDAIPQNSVTSKMLDRGFGYISINRFLSKTTREMEQALADVTDSRTLKGLVLDLRYNPGGLMEQAINITDFFLEEGLIVVTKGRLNKQKKAYRARIGARRYDFPIIILVNEGSASATEIIAAALKENHRAVIIGSQTFGKGSVQTIYPLKNGSALRLTTSEFFTPSGLGVQEMGVSPDLIAEMSDRNLDFMTEKKLNTSLPKARHSTPDNIPKVTLGNTSKDPMLSLALELLHNSRTDSYNDLQDSIKKVASHISNNGD